MKSLKAVAVLAGSLAVAGAAAPAFAAEGTTLAPAGLSDGVRTLLATGPAGLMPLQSPSRALDTENKDSVLHAVNTTTEKLNSSGALLGGLPLRS